MFKDLLFDSLKNKTSTKRVISIGCALLFAILCCVSFVILAFVIFHKEPLPNISDAIDGIKYVLWSLMVIITGVGGFSIAEILSKNGKNSR